MKKMNSNLVPQMITYHPKPTTNIMQSQITRMAYSKTWMKLRWHISYGLKNKSDLKIQLFEEKWKYLVWILTVVMELFWSEMLTMSRAMLVFKVSKLISCIKNEIVKTFNFFQSLNEIISLML